MNKKKQLPITRGTELAISDVDEASSRRRFLRMTAAGSVAAMVGSACTGEEDLISDYDENRAPSTDDFQGNSNNERDAHSYGDGSYVVCNVKDYGAVGDGEADDTDAIQDALDAHQKVYLPQGTYRISAKLQINTLNQELFGDGMYKTFIYQSTNNQ